KTIRVKMEGTPTNQLIVSMRTSDRDAVAAAAAVLDMRQRLERAGEVLFLKTYGELQRTVVIFGSIECLISLYTRPSCALLLFSRRSSHFMSCLIFFFYGLI